MVKIYSDTRPGGRADACGGGQYVDFPAEWGYSPSLPAVYRSLSLDWTAGPKHGWRIADSGYLPHRPSVEG